jgi:antitoxin (DNA-binding transcriptional repressor) of toxin-antitoxin stability system
MTKDVTVAELGEHLAAKLEEVKNGTTLRVIDGGEAIAKIAPAHEKPTTTSLPRPVHNETDDDTPFLPPRLKFDSLEHLLVERGKKREFATFPDPSLGPLGKWTPPSLHLDWDPVDDLVAERDRYR